MKKFWGKKSNHVLIFWVSKFFETSWMCSFLSLELSLDLEYFQILAHQARIQNQLSRDVIQTKARQPFDTEYFNMEVIIWYPQSGQERGHHSVIHVLKKGEISVIWSWPSSQLFWLLPPHGDTDQGIWLNGLKISPVYFWCCPYVFALLDSCHILKHFVIFFQKFSYFMKGGNRVRTAFPGTNLYAFCL